MKNKRLHVKHKKMWMIGLVLVVVLLVFMMGRKEKTSAFVEETPAIRDICTYKSFVGNVEPAEETAVICKVSQQVTELKVEEGNRVKKGDVLAVIDTSSVEQNIEKAELSLSGSKNSNAYTISDAQRNYDNYKEALDKGLNSSLNSAKNTMDNAYNTLQQAKEDYETAVWRIDNGVYSATQVKYDAREAAQSRYDAQKAEVEKIQEAWNATPEDTELESRLDAAKLELESAESALAEAQLDFAWAKQEIIESKQAAIDNAQTSYNTASKNYEVTKLSVEQQLETYKAALDKTKGTSNTNSAELELQQLKESLEDYIIYAPCDGIVTELNIKEGGMVSAGSCIATISDLDAMKVAIQVDEYSILDTGAGSSVTILVDSIGKSYEGILSKVSDTATLNNGVAYFEAEAAFTADEYVKSGMSVEVRLTSVNKTEVLTISADALHYKEDNTAYVLVKNGDTQKVRDVELGVTDGDYVEILSGVSLEDVILVTPSYTEMLLRPGMVMGETK